MRIAIEWIKSNVISVISIAVVLVSLGFLIWVPHSKGKGELVGELEQWSKKINALQSMRSQNVVVPAPRPDSESMTIQNVTINADVIDKLTTLYQGMNEQYEGVFDTAVQFNRNHHEPLIDGLFPQWSASNPDIPFQARVQYLRSFDRMFQPYDPENPNAPRLNAGSPPTAEYIQVQIDQERRDFVNVDVAGAQLTPQEQSELDRVLREKLVDLLRLRAEQIHIYAHRSLDRLMSGRSYGQAQAVFPFQVREWAFSDSPPQPHQLWEGQLELWMQQDIVRAISKTNQVDVAVPDMNVIKAPVKRLVQIQIVPGYIGLHTAGVASSGSLGAQTTGSRGSSGGAVMSSDGAYGNPIGGQRTNDPDAQVSDNFYVGPTGRVSNALYDVRQAVLTVVVDYRRLPELINAMGEVNFMTVLNVQVQDVDEYEALREGYMYGSDDVVRATLVVESIWLRQWTEPLMPDRVRSYVGIDEPTAEQTGPGMMGPGMMMDPYMDGAFETYDYY